MVSAADWRDVVFTEGADVAETWGKTLGWTDADGTAYQPPVPFVEAVIDLESGGNPAIADSPGNAIGLMQIVPTGQEASWWMEYTGEPIRGDDLRHPNALSDPRHDNIRVGILGLGERMQQVCAISPQTCNWFYAGAAYFGAVPNPDGSFPPKHDAFGTSGQDYYNHLENYVSTKIDVGTDLPITHALEAGQWQEVGKREGVFALPDFVENAIDYAKGTYDALGDLAALPGRILGWIETHYVNIALVGGGIAVVLAGIALFVGPKGIVKMRPEGQLAAKAGRVT